MQFNFHTHTKYSDGHQTCTEAIEAAIDAGFNLLGFSDHGPVPFTNKWNFDEKVIQLYFEEIDKLQEKYKGKIELLKGVEGDYIDSMCDLQFFKQFSFDYIIGAVHYFPYQFKDGYYFNFDTREDLFIAGMNEFFAGDTKKMVATYFEHINKMLLSSKPDIVAHLDIIGKFNNQNKFYTPSEKWHKDLIEETLNLIKEKDCIIEVNARRKYKNFHHDNSPTTEILESVLKKNIPITISGDIHYSSDFPLYWVQTLQHVKQLGFGELMYIDKKGWHSLTI